MDRAVRKPLVPVAERTLLVVDGRIYYDGPTQALVNGTAPEASVLGIFSQQ